MVILCPVIAVLRQPGNHKTYGSDVDKRTKSKNSRKPTGIQLVTSPEIRRRRRDLRPSFESSSSSSTSGRSQNSVSAWQASMSSLPWVGSMTVLERSWVCFGRRLSWKNNYCQFPLRKLALDTMFACIQWWISNGHSGFIRGASWSPGLSLACLASSSPISISTSQLITLCRQWTMALTKSSPRLTNLCSM